MAKVVTKSFTLARFFFVPSLRNSREMVGCEAKPIFTIWRLNLKVGNNRR